MQQSSSFMNSVLKPDNVRENGSLNNNCFMMDKKHVMTRFYIYWALSFYAAIFFIHLVFTSWGLQSDWAPTSYFFYNLLFLMVLLWGLHQQESENPIVMAFYFDIICFILDIVNVGVFFPSRSGSTSRRFSAGMAIVNMLLRPLTAFFLYKILGERNALYGGSAYQDSHLAEIFSNPNNRQGRYQDIGQIAVPSQELRAAAAASAEEINTSQKV